MEPVKSEHGPDHDSETSTTTLADPSNNTTFQSTDWNKVKPSRSASTNKLETPLPPSSWWTSPLMKDTAQPPLTIAPTAATSSTCKTQSTTANLSTQHLACASPTAGQTSQMTTALTFHPHGRVKSSKRVFICCNVTSCGYNLTIIKNKSGLTFNIPYVWQKNFLQKTHYHVAECMLTCFIYFNYTQQLFTRYWLLHDEHSDGMKRFI